MPIPSGKFHFCQNYFPAPGHFLYHFLYKR